MLSSIFIEIGKTEDGKQRLELLTNLQTAMGNLSRAQLIEHMNNLNLELLFACLDSDNL